MTVYQTRLDDVGKHIVHLYYIVGQMRGDELEHVILLYA